MSKVLTAIAVFLMTFNPRVLSDISGIPVISSQLTFTLIKECVGRKAILSFSVNNQVI